MSQSHLFLAAQKLKSCVVKSPNVYMMQFYCNNYVVLTSLLRMAMWSGSGGAVELLFC